MARLCCLTQLGMLLMGVCKVIPALGLYLLPKTARSARARPNPVRSTAGSTPSPNQRRRSPPRNNRRHIQRLFLADCADRGTRWRPGRSPHRQERQRHQSLRDEVRLGRIRNQGARRAAHARAKGAVQGDCRDKKGRASDIRDDIRIETQQALRHRPVRGDSG